MISILLAMGLTCPATIVTNNTSGPWTDVDNQNFNIALKRCTELYSNSPCLKYFIKKQELTYQAICGKGKK